MVLFGGFTTEFFQGWPTWERTGDQWKQRAAPGPAYREFAGMAYDAARRQTVLFGGRLEGQNGDYAGGDTWLWDGTGWRQFTGDGPPARGYAAMAYDSARGVTVLYGGSTVDFDGAIENRFGDTWEWDGSAWTERQVTGPSPRADCYMSYGAARHVIVLFGGFIVGGTSGETWEWDGVNWTLRMVSGPPGEHRGGYGARRTSSEDGADGWERHRFDVGCLGVGRDDMDPASSRWANTSHGFHPHIRLGSPGVCACWRFQFHGRFE